jgi:hypothetical protein
MIIPPYPGMYDKDCRHYRLNFGKMQGVFATAAIESSHKSLYITLQSLSFYGRLYNESNSMRVMGNFINKSRRADLHPLFCFNRLD